MRALPGGAAQLWSDGEVTLYGRDGRVRQQLNATRGPVTDAVLSPDGTWAATVGAGGAIGLWDVDPVSGSWTAREQLIGHSGEVVDAVDRPVRRPAWSTVGVDDRVVVWDATAGGGFGTSVQGLPDRSITAPPQIVEPDRLVVVPTVPAAAPSGRPTGCPSSRRSSGPTPERSSTSPGRNRRRPRPASSRR